METLLSHKRKSRMPRSQPLPKGSVLCLDIDGVCAPFGQNLRFHSLAPHPGFVSLPTHAATHVHPALPQWAEELAQAFAHVVWISSRQENCALFAAGAGMPFAAEWPYLDLFDSSDETGRGYLPWGKLDAVLQWVRVGQPVAFVDDELVPQRWPYERKADIDCSIEITIMRPGPVLLLAPAREIGLTRKIVDLLCAFARNPYGGLFDDRRVHQFDSGRWVQWPWPLSPDQEDPVTVLPADEEAWERDHCEKLRVRYLERNGTEPSSSDESWCHWRD